jgi:hypothetical protein
MQLACMHPHSRNSRPQNRELDFTVVAHESYNLGSNPE